jgi:hypothetical protein
MRRTIPGFLINAIITNSILWFSDTLPLRAIWLAAFSWIIGGGPTVALVIIWTMLADLTTDSQRAIVFFRVGVMSMAASFVSSATSSALMTLNPWTPLTVGCGIVIIGLTFALSLPETIYLPSRKTSPGESDVQVSNANESSLDDESFSSTAQSAQRGLSSTSFLPKIRENVQVCSGMSIAFFTARPIPLQVVADQRCLPMLRIVACFLAMLYPRKLGTALLP